MAVGDAGETVEVRDGPALARSFPAKGQPVPPSIVLRGAGTDALPPILCQDQGIERSEAFRHENRQGQGGRTPDPVFAMHQNAVADGHVAGRESDAFVEQGRRDGGVVLDGEMQEVDLLPPQDVDVVQSFIAEVDDGAKGLIMAQALEFRVRQPSADGQGGNDPGQVH